MKIGKKRIYSGETIASGFGRALVSGDVVVTICDIDPFVHVTLEGKSHVFRVHKNSLKKNKKNKDAVYKFDPNHTTPPKNMYCRCVLTPVDHSKDQKREEKEPKGKYQIVDASDNLDRSRLFIHYAIESEASSEFVCECNSIGAANVIVAALDSFNDAFFTGSEG